MTGLLNKTRPPTFCPGCGHEQAVVALDKAFSILGWQGNEIVIVSDIGCSGLFDTFFNTHAFHGLHGRALSYGVGIKLARPEVNVVVTMGDGGFGIGAAHFISACRRNLDITLLVLNNFNFGMTGGQCSCTTPNDMNTGSGFLNQLERPIDICRIAVSGGAGYVGQLSAYQKDLPEKLAEALSFKGFSVLDLQGICSGRVTRRNRFTPRMIEDALSQRPFPAGPIADNLRGEYGKSYRETAALQPAAPRPIQVRKKFRPLIAGREEILILGGAGQRVITSGEILCMAGMASGLKATCKSDYPVTVLRGHSVSEVVLSSETIGFTGIEKPSIVIVLSQEGVERRRSLIEKIDDPCFVIQATGVSFSSRAVGIQVDFHAIGIKTKDWALASLGVLAVHNKCISEKMLNVALSVRFQGETLKAALEITDKVLKGIRSA